MTKRYRVFLDRFTAGLDELTRKQQRDTVEVLRCLDRIKRFSVFEATANQDIAGTMDRLQREKLIETHEVSGYPWLGVTLTEAGRRLIGGGE